MGSLPSSDRTRRDDGCRSLPQPERSRATAVHALSKCCSVDHIKFHAHWVCATEILQAGAAARNEIVEVISSPICRKSNFRWNKTHSDGIASTGEQNKKKVKLGRRLLSAFAKNQSSDYICRGSADRKCNTFTKRLDIW